MLDILVDLREGAQRPTISEKHRSELKTPVVEGIIWGSGKKSYVAFGGAASGESDKSDLGSH